MTTANPPRAPIELKVEYKKLNTFFADYAKNISKGGTFIKTERPLPVGTEFLFKLTLPKVARLFELRGQVEWINTSALKANPEVADLGMGIRFQFADTVAQNTFRASVESLMVDAFGEPLAGKLIGRPPLLRSS